MSGIDPPFYKQVVLPVLAAFPNPEAYRLLDALGIRCVYVRGEVLDPARFRLVKPFVAANSERFRLVFQSGNDVVLERLGELTAPALREGSGARVPTTPLPAGCTAQALLPRGAVPVPGESGRGEGWVSDDPQRGGETVAIECTQPITAAGIWLDLGGRFAGYPRGVTVQHKGDDGAWEAALIEDDAIDLERLVLHPLAAEVVNRFVPVRARSWRIIQTGWSLRDPWAVAGIGVVPPPS